MATENTNEQNAQAEIDKLLGTRDKIEWELRNFAPLDDHMTSTRQSIAHLNKELNKVSWQSACGIFLCKLTVC